MTYVILMGAIDLSLGALLGLGEVVTATLVSHIGYWAFAVAVLVGLARRTDQRRWSTCG